MSASRLPGFDRPRLLFDEKYGRIIGCGSAGPDAGDPAAAAALAIGMDADATDIGAAIHPHPTPGETIGKAAGMFEGTITHPAQEKTLSGSARRALAALTAEEVPRWR